MGQAVLQSSAIQRVVKLPVEAKKKLVVVALVVVEFPVMFKLALIVVEPVSKRLERVVKPAVAVSVPVKEAVEEMVCELIKPEEIGPVERAPEVRVPMVPIFAKRLEVEALFEA